MEVSQIIEASFVLILVYLILTNARGFDQVVGASTSGFTGAVGTLQGR